MMKRNISFSVQITIGWLVAYLLLWLFLSVQQSHGAGSLTQVSAWDVPIIQDGQWHLYAWTNTTGSPIYIKQWQTFVGGPDWNLSGPGGNLGYGGPDEHWSFSPDYWTVGDGQALIFYVRGYPGQQGAAYCWFWYTTTP
jgi:hypothetical protein